jgi:hypothetical protein
MLYRPVADSAHSEHQNSDEQGNVQMSTSFVTKHPMSLDEAARLLRDAGCTVEIREDCWAVAKDRDGNYFHLTDDPECYTTLSIDLSADELTAYPTEIHDGTKRVMGECYGLNDPDLMATILNMVSEHDDEFEQIMGAGVPVPNGE